MNVKTAPFAWYAETHEPILWKDGKKVIDWRWTRSKDAAQSVKIK